MENKNNDMILRRMRATNASLQKDLASASRKMGETALASKLNAEQLAFVSEELSAARKTIRDLEAKIKTLTSSLSDSLAKKNAKSGKNYDQTANQDATGRY